MAGAEGEPWLTVTFGPPADGPRLRLVRDDFLAVMDPEAAGFSAVAPLGGAIELTRTPRTDPVAWERAQVLVAALGKVALEVEDVPGLVSAPGGLPDRQRGGVPAGVAARARRRTSTRGWSSACAIRAGRSRGRRRSGWMPWWPRSTACTTRWARSAIASRRCCESARRWAWGYADAMSTTTDTDLLTERAGGILTLTLNRPDSLNSLTPGCSTASARGSSRRPTTTRSAAS